MGNSHNLYVKYRNSFSIKSKSDKIFSIYRKYQTNFNLMVSAFVDVLRLYFTTNNPITIVYNVYLDIYAFLILNNNIIISSIPKLQTQIKDILINTDINSLYLFRMNQYKEVLISIPFSIIANIRNRFRFSFTILIPNFTDFVIAIATLLKLETHDPYTLENRDVLTLGEMDGTA